MTIAPKFIQKNSQNALMIAIITSAISALISIASVCMTYHFATETQNRQVRLEQISKFDTNGAQLIDAGGQFVAAINNNSKNLREARIKMSTVVASQLHDSENLRKFFDKRVNKLVSDYQSAISELNGVAQKTSSVTEMRPWTESFGRALDAKSLLSEQLYSAVGRPRA